MAAEVGAGVGGAAAHLGGDVDAAGEGEVGALSDHRAVEGEEAAALDAEGAPHGGGAAVEAGGEVCAGEGDGGVFEEFEFGADEGEFEGGGGFVVVEEDVGEAEGVGVHRAGDGDAVALEAVASQVLDGGVEAAFYDFEGGHGYSGASVRVS